MIYILDTDLFSLAVLPDSPEYLRLHRRALDLSMDDKLVTTIITYEEQTRGWLEYARRAKDPEHQVRAYRLLRQHLLNYLAWDLLDFDNRAAEEFAKFRLLKLRVGTMDLRIAAIALANDATVITRNLLDFRKVPNLRAENWAQG